MAGSKKNLPTPLYGGIGFPGSSNKLYGTLKINSPDVEYAHCDSPGDFYEIPEINPLDDDEIIVLSPPRSGLRLCGGIDAIMEKLYSSYESEPKKTGDD